MPYAPTSGIGVMTMTSTLFLQSTRTIFLPLYVVPDGKVSKSVQIKLQPNTHSLRTHIHARGSCFLILFLGDIAADDTGRIGRAKSRFQRLFVCRCSVCLCMIYNIALVPDISVRILYYLFMNTLTFAYIHTHSNNINTLTFKQ